MKFIRARNYQPRHQRSSTLLTAPNSLPLTAPQLALRCPHNPSPHSKAADPFHPRAPPPTFCTAAESNDQAPAPSPPLVQDECHDGADAPSPLTTTCFCGDRMRSAGWGSHHRSGDEWGAEGVSMTCVGWYGCRTVGVVLWGSHMEAGGLTEATAAYWRVLGCRQESRVEG